MLSSPGVNPGSRGEVRAVSEEHQLQLIEVKKVLTFGELGYILEISPEYKCMVTIGNPHERETVKNCRLRNHMLSTRRKLKIGEICTIGGPWTALTRLKLPYIAIAALS